MCVSVCVCVCVPNIRTTHPVLASQAAQRLVPGALSRSLVSVIVESNIDPLVANLAAVELGDGVPSVLNAGYLDGSNGCVVCLCPHTDA